MLYPVIGPTLVLPSDPWAYQCLFIIDKVIVYLKDKIYLRNNQHGSISSLHFPVKLIFHSDKILYRYITRFWTKYTEHGSDCDHSYRLKLASVGYFYGFSFDKNKQSTHTYHFPVFFWMVWNHIFLSLPFMC